MSQICKQSFPRPQTNSQTSDHSNLLLSGDKAFYIKLMFSRERFSVFILSRYTIADKKAGITWIFLESWSLVSLDNRFWKPLEIFLCIFWEDLLREWNDDSVAEMSSADFQNRKQAVKSGRKIVIVARPLVIHSNGKLELDFHVTKNGKE